ncbi:uncharacterized protein L969DRAFT_96006 [Mixia osmundae IAM 14324]|uniref:Inhibitor of apoptosis repeat-containing protein n=1 Tax=Mixia osmundae (strain CBS 9802 / IAM 14324 / JCM 22182 / KY 12970) TaxID=764103 RepID=G7DWR8_MIXOS|nr:uncharacterized protein L969DRAFT_97551 [Mixia osmundae IAM 14324]XP_014566733.1 uncharacterized protein L969DRAFT_96006 [Mixia osmundae IAM 14324]KEI36207.1 hypothetical protein L969DRAFT_97551 [Mixia osmundae IAM 14324]KEI38175.1 hypothetical protein L969DRAFT_96006 [Mixia osmundae IAM 14324]GAA95015.1 hypothetical protein E5Q_01670 [Mixia osmundae IAM 14324]
MASKGRAKGKARDVHKQQEALLAQPAFRIGTFENGGIPKTNIAWPHPAEYGITPRSLAEAGFYYSPSVGDEDNATCFLCARSYGGWSEDDDATQEHFRHQQYAGECAFAHLRKIHSVMGASVQAGLPIPPLEDWMENPTSEHETRMRFTTFGTWWPHDKRGWTPNAKNIAEAGFFFSPDIDDGRIDTALCPYCGTGLDGWEKDDIPFDEHHKRKTHCAFVQAELARRAKAVESAPKASTSKRSNLAASRSKPTSSASIGSRASAADDVPEQATRVEPEEEPRPAVLPGKRQVSGAKRQRQISTDSIARRPPDRTETTGVQTRRVTRSASVASLASSTRSAPPSHDEGIADGPASSSPPLPQAKKPRRKATKSQTRTVSKTSQIPTIDLGSTSLDLPDEPVHASKILHTVEQVSREPAPAPGHLQAPAEATPRSSTSTAFHSVASPDHSFSIIEAPEANEDATLRLPVINGSAAALPSSPKRVSDLIALPPAMTEAELDMTVEEYITRALDRDAGEAERALRQKLEVFEKLSAMHRQRIEQALL